MRHVPAILLFIFMFSSLGIGLFGLVRQIADKHFDYQFERVR